MACINQELLTEEPRIQSSRIERSDNDQQDVQTDITNIVEGIPLGIEIPDTKDNILDNCVDKPQVKKRINRLKELDKLKIKNEPMFDEEFDAYADDNKVYRKYRLRDTRNIQKKKKIESKPPLKRRRNSDEGTYHCTMCAKEFDSKTGLLNHKRMHLTEKKFTCALCLSNFGNNALLVAHKAIHDEEKRSYFCTKCKVAFSDHLDFIIHIVSHTKRKLYKCIECGAFYRKESYKAHVYMHYDRKKFCEICSKHYSERHFAKHMKTHENQSASSHICVECGKDCKTKTYYRYHLNTHTGVKMYQCLYCGKGFNNNGQRRMHTRVHTNERPFSCDVCLRTFKHSSEMLKHKITHETEKKFQCDICRKKFIHKLDLRNHMRGHTKESLYKCPDCKDSFTTSTGLKSHVLYTHTTERPVRCELCDKGFINNNQYQRHTRTKYHKRNVYGANFKNEE